MTNSIQDPLRATLEAIANGQVMTGKFTHAETVLRYQEIARKALAAPTPASELLNCREAGPGKGMCDMCAAGYYDCCRYVVPLNKQKPYKEWVREITSSPDSEQQSVGELPPLNDDMRNILGRMCFQCIRIAQVLRLMGHEIEEKAEAEQAAVLHWMLGLYFKHGNEWRDRAEIILKDAAIASQRQPSEKGGA